jgi:hypothetical protein
VGLVGSYRWRTLFCDGQWIGLREHLQENTPYLMGKSVVSCKISLKPIQSDGIAGLWK